ncbi:amphoterin-induced protein 2-like [Erpetoichthys calabaricus]|uniref:Adhesion molecule with Ig like domain 2 n=1 Tax=Erpetoichthys calabaricus TaxID=27687 RepID=A0A8C4SHX1_ERPCA|nr:amphoterin-induced protein 2-like [Erpetoichthys calabaricus]XP_028666435.1 amphoterin-induced protein 2-like [Erpetoichthys calabaricus]
MDLTLFQFFSLHRGRRLTPKSIPFALLLCASLACSSLGSCPDVCICASDIITCTNKNLSTVPSIVFKFINRLDLSYNKITILSGDWASRPLDKLNTLIFSYNSISTVSLGAFRNVASVRYLDLSSNRLNTLDKNMFHDLKELEILLLFNNGITRINSGAFGGLEKLQKLYLSKNFLSEFPMELLFSKYSLAQLELLDLSSNLIKEVPVQKIIALPARQQYGLYLHENPFICDCALQTMILYWKKRKFRSVIEFNSDYNCFSQSSQKVPINPSPNSDDSMNCSNSTINGSFFFSGMIYEVRIGDRLVAHCDSKIADVSSNFYWVTPSQELIQPGDETLNLKVFHNGSLELHHARPEDSGIYKCIAVSNKRNLNETVEVTFKVTNSTDKPRGHETFNTAFTTLAACVASIVLVLIYLYLTPCRCWCKAKKTERKQNAGSGRSSILSAAVSSDIHSERKTSTGKRVVFLEPGTENQPSQNGKVKLLSSEQGMTESILKNSRAKCDSDSVTSLFSDSPFVA